MKTCFDGHFFVIDEKEWNKMVEFYNNENLNFPFEDCSIETGTLDTSEVFDNCDIIKGKFDKKTLEIIYLLENTSIPETFRELMEKNKKKSKTKSKN